MTSGLREIWQAAGWWPAWLLTLAGLFALREGWALASGRPQDTLSDWLRARFEIVSHAAIAQWSPATLGFFAVWTLAFVWLTWHIFFYSRMFSKVGL